MYCDTLLLSLINDTHETNIHRQTQLYQTSYIYIYIEVFTHVPWTLMYSSFTVFWILIQKVLIRLLPYLIYKFSINKRINVNQDGPSLIIEAPPPPRSPQPPNSQIG